MRAMLSAVVLCLCLPPVGAGAAGDEPIALHPDNPHYFLWRDRPTVLITSAEHYGAVLNLDFDYVAYLDELERHGLNLTRVFSGAYREIPGSFGITNNTLAPKPHRYACPWKRTDQEGYFDGGGKFDLLEYDPEYFRRLRDFVAQAAKRGVIVELALFCPMYKEELWQACPMNAANNVNGIGQVDRESVYALKEDALTEVQFELTRRIVQAVNEFDNVIVEVCNEPYFGGVTREWQHKIVDVIVDTEKSLPRRHLISMNIANGRAKIENPHPHVSVFNFHYCYPPDVVGMNYELNKVIGENETGFRGSDDVLYRTEGWDFILAGGALYNNLDYSFTPQHPAGDLRDYASPGGGSVELRQQLGILKRLMDDVDFIHMRPGEQVVASVTEDLVATALSKPGEQYLIYLHVPVAGKKETLADRLRENVEATVTLNLPTGPYNVQWINTLTGGILHTEVTPSHGDAITLETPPFDNDVALRITRQ